MSQSVGRCYDSRMRFMRLAENTRVAPLVAAFFLCAAVLLCAHQFVGFAAGIGFSPDPVAEHSSHSGSMGAGGGGQTQPGGYVPASLEEVEASDEDPVNAESLASLLLVVFFGAVLGLLFGGRMWRRDVASLLTERRLASVTCCLPKQPSASRLSVFLL